MNATTTIHAETMVASIAVGQRKIAEILRTAREEVGKINGQILPHQRALLKGLKKNEINAAEIVAAIDTYHVYTGDLISDLVDEVELRSGEKIFPSHHTENNAREG